MLEFDLFCKDSILEKEFKNLLKNSNIKVVSFDIFETLVFRKLTNPSDIFTLVGKYKYVRDIFDCPDNFKQLRVEAERLARHENKNSEDINIELIYKQLPLNIIQREKLIQLEIEVEFENIYINKQVENWIKYILELGKEIVFTSDMYLSKSQLEYIVFSKIENFNVSSNLFVSSEYGLTKATGNLFREILNILNINSREMLHIGDNFHGDVKMASDLEIYSLYYNINDSYKKSYILDYEYIYSGLNKGNNFRIQSALLNPFEKEKENFFFNLGSSIFGPILWGFSNWINELAIKNDINQINCVMREGRVFQKYISKINPSLSTNLIYASRKSTFLPSINSEDIEEKGFNFYNYRKFSVRNFYNLFKLSFENKIINKFQNILIKDANLIKIGNSNLLEIVSEDFNYRINEVKKNIEEEKKLFLSYLEQIDFSENSIVIDFGGTGSILQNIKKIISSPITNNVLFYMHESGFNRMIKENIFSFFPFNKNTGKKIELLRRSPEFIEILFNGVNKTTLSYLKDENNKVIPQTDFPYEDIDTTQSIINAFDKGIDCFFAVAFEYGINAKVYEPEELLYLLSRLIEVPTKEECFNLGQLQHDEGYGSILIERIIEDKHLTSIKDISVEKAYSRFIKNLSYKINEVPWIQGVITSINENYIKQMRGLEVKSVNSDAINSLLEVLDENNHINEIYVYGAGQFLHELLPYLLHRNIVLKGILDTRANFSNFRFLDFEVKSLTDIDFEMEDTIIISSVVFATDITSLILDTIKNKNLKIMIINHYNGLIHL